MDELVFSRIECGERIKALRIDNGLNQEEFSLMLHTTQSNLSKIEKGISTPSIDVLFEIRKQFHVSIDYIVYGFTYQPEPISNRLHHIHSMVTEIGKELTIMNTIHTI